MSKPVYSWFWQPPLDGKPGLLMIVDNHPDPRETGIPVVLERLKDVIPEIEVKLPMDINLGALSIFLRDPTEHWYQITVNPMNRRFTTSRPTFKQGELAELWESRL